MIDLMQSYEHEIRERMESANHIKKLIVYAYKYSFFLLQLRSFGYICARS